jgi:hypothetical protein
MSKFLIPSCFSAEYANGIMCPILSQVQRDASITRTQGHLKNSGVSDIFNCSSMRKGGKRVATDDLLAALPRCLHILSFPNSTENCQQVILGYTICTTCLLMQELVKKIGPYTLTLNRTKGSSIELSPPMAPVSCWIGRKKLSRHPPHMLSSIDG